MSRKKKGLLVFLRNYFFTGLFFLLPFYLTFAVIKWSLLFIHKYVSALPLPAGEAEFLSRFGLEVLVVLGFLLGLVIIGGAISNLFGRSIVRFLNRIVERIPLVSSLYTAIKSLVDGLASGSRKAFKKVLYLEYPRKGLWVIGFLTGSMKIKGKKHSTVFIPTSPNPTSGFLVFINPGDTIETDLSVEEGFKIIVSGGIISPPDQKSKND